MHFLLEGKLYIKHLFELINILCISMKILETNKYTHTKVIAIILMCNYNFRF